MCEKLTLYSFKFDQRELCLELRSGNAALKEKNDNNNNFVHIMQVLYIPVY